MNYNIPQNQIRSLLVQACRLSRSVFQELSIRENVQECSSLRDGRCATRASAHSGPMTVVPTVSKCTRSGKFTLRNNDNFLHSLQFVEIMVTVPHAQSPCAASEPSVEYLERLMSYCCVFGPCSENSRVGFAYTKRCGLRIQLLFSRCFSLSTSLPRRKSVSPRMPSFVIMR